MSIFIKKAARLLCIVGMVMLCAGCGKDEGDGEVLVVEPPSKDYETLSASDAAKFSYQDLVVDSLSAGNSEAAVRAVYGEPMAVRDNEETKERIYFYDQMTMTFCKTGEAYELAGVRVTGKDYALARGLKVGATREAVLQALYRDENCLNQNVMSGDNETILGKFLYGDYTMDQLEEKKTKDTVQYGIISYNGALSMEEAEKLTFQYVCFEKPFMGETATLNDDFAQLDIELDKTGKIVEISWYFYEELK